MTTEQEEKMSDTMHNMEVDIAVIKEKLGKIEVFLVKDNEEIRKRLSSLEQKVWTFSGAAAAIGALAPYLFKRFFP